MSRLDTLKRQFLVEVPPAPSGPRRRVFVRPTRRPWPPQRGARLLRWIIEEADEQLQLGARIATVSISKTDLKLLRFFMAWLPDRSAPEADA